MPDIQKGRNTVIEDGAKIGENCVLGHNVVIHSGVVIGDNVTVGDNTVLGKEPSGQATAQRLISKPFHPLT